MDASIFFKNGDPSEPKLNAEGSFNKDFQGSFADEKSLSMCGAPKEEETFGFTRESLINPSASSEGGKASQDSALDTLLKSQGDGKLSTGAWIGISVAVIVVFGGLGYILYKKYK